MFLNGFDFKLEFELVHLILDVQLPIAGLFDGGSLAVGDELAEERIIDGYLGVTV